MPKISVIMPSYNHSNYIQFAIESVLNQTYEDFEFLIADDFSEDNSKIIIEKYKDSRIKTFFLHENVGASQTTNFLIDKAKGTYIALINSDDYWHSDKLKKQINFLENNSQYGACFTGVFIIDEKGNLIKTKDKFLVENFSRENWVLNFFERGNLLCHPSVMLKKDLYLSMGKYSLIYKQLPDFDMWVRVIKKTNIYILEEKLTFYRWFLTEKRNDSYPTANNLIQFGFESNKILSTFFEDMEKELFINSFKNKLINPNITEISEAKCEQYFLLLNGKNYLKEKSFLAAIDYFIEIYKEDSVRICFKEKYNYTIANFYEETKRFNVESIRINKINLNMKKIVCFLKRIIRKFY